MQGARTKIQGPLDEEENERQVNAGLELQEEVKMRSIVDGGVLALAVGSFDMSCSNKFCQNFCGCTISTTGTTLLSRLAQLDDSHSKCPVGLPKPGCNLQPSDTPTEFQVLLR